MRLHNQAHSFDETIPVILDAATAGGGISHSANATPPPQPSWARHQSVCGEEFISLPASVAAAAAAAQKPEICVTNSSGELVTIPAGGADLAGGAPITGLGVPATTLGAATTVLAGAGLMSGGQSGPYGLERMDESYWRD